MVASSRSFTLSRGKIIPFPSPFKSIPVFSPKPNKSRYENSLSFPRVRPSFTNPGLLGFYTGTFLVLKKNLLDKFL